MNRLPSRTVTTVATVPFALTRAHACAHTRERDLGAIGIVATVVTVRDGRGG